MGIAPTKLESGAYIPSPVALFFANFISPKYKQVDYGRTYQGSERILMICTEHDEMIMENGTRFFTGNHPVEMMLPILHFEKAGFTVDVCTPNGLPVKIEEWTVPKKDKAVIDGLERYRRQLEAPMSLTDIVQDLAFDLPYLAVFIPGGHGSMVGLPENKEVGSVLRWAFEKDKFVISICHGPSVFMAANNGNDSFVFKGFKVAAFSDLLDRITFLFGYIPGKMQWFVGESLEKMGVNVAVSFSSGKVCHDLNVITGDGPSASNKLGKIATAEMLRSTN